jgi:hypothetical protein
VFNTQVVNLKSSIVATKNGSGFLQVEQASAAMAARGGDSSAGREAVSAAWPSVGYEPSKTQRPVQRNRLGFGRRHM